VAAIFELVTAGNSSVKDGVYGESHKRAVIEAHDTILELLAVLGVDLSAVASGHEGEGELPAGVVALAANLADYQGEDPALAVDLLLGMRMEARAQKNWALADAVRDGLAELGFVIEDTVQGTRIVRK